VLNALSSQDLGSYWFSTGTPTFSIKLMQSNNLSLDQLEKMEMSEQALGDVDSMLTSPVPVLYQSGYLTIKSYNFEDNLYTLDFSNNEVTDGFFNSLLPYYTTLKSIETDSTIKNLRLAINAADIDEFMLIMKSFFAGYDYSLIGKQGLEAHYQNVIFAVCKLIGLRVKAEYHMSNGRIDMLLETKDSVFIFEFKLNVGTKRALKQIAQKDYAALFATDSREIYKIGVNFSYRIRGIKDRKVVE